MQLIVEFKNIKGLKTPRRNNSVKAVILSEVKHHSAVFYEVEPSLRMVTSTEGRIYEQHLIHSEIPPSAPSHRSGSTSQTIHRIVCFAQDDRFLLFG